MSTVSHDTFDSSPAQYNGYSQQYIEELAGIDKRILCAPTAFYHLAERMGYDIPLEDYVGMVKQELNASTGDQGWNRGRLSKTLREQWGVNSVSCWTKSLGSRVSDESLKKMQDAGYLSDAQVEVDFLNEIMDTVSEGPKGVVDLVKLGIPVVTTVEPGFATNKAKHAVVIEAYNDTTGLVRVFDPDERNSESNYSVEWLEEYLSLDGGTTVMLPPQVDSERNDHELAA